MLKYIAILSNAVALLIYNFFFADPVSVNQKMPVSAKPESEFVVELTINKASLGGFAKLQQTLPAGFTAVEDKSNGASFTNSGTVVKFIWMSLPLDNEIKVSYKVLVPAGVSGDKIISGTFSYIADNVKQSIDIPSSSISITSFETPQPLVTNKISEPTKATDTTIHSNSSLVVSEPVVSTPLPNQVTTAPAEKTSVGNPNEGLTASLVRKISDVVNGDFNVDVTINKANLKGFAKLVELMPIGYTASVIETSDASFTFDDTDKKAKFVWLSIPVQSEIKISYKVHMVNPADVQGISGVFTYLENDETKKFILASTLPGNTSLVANANNETLVTKPVSSEPLVTPEDVNSTKSSNTSSTTQSESLVSLDQNTKVNDVQKTTLPETIADSSDKSLSANNFPISQGNVSYSVQIAALHKAVNAAMLATKYKLTEAVNTEMVDGFTKYTVGLHKEYKDAHDSRENIRDKGVVGPWIASYNNGKRITVQEALMISNQKWFK